jgi:beta-glucosidase
MHGVAADLGEAAALALAAGIDVELPTGDAFLGPLKELVQAGGVDVALIDRAVLRVLAQKEELGLLDASFDEPPTEIDLDTPEHRDVALRLAEESLVLLTNDGTLPLADAPARIAVLGPNADAPEALMGCYSFANHVLAHHPEVPLGFELPSVLEAVRAEFPEASVAHERGCAVEGDDRSGIPAAVAAASAADVAVVVVGDRAGLFGRGTVGEGNDVESLELPGIQRELVERVVATGTPVVLVVLSGRPYAISWAVEGVTAPAAVLQAFFPGEEGGCAIAAVLSGRVSPSGHLPVSLPRSAGAQPYSYLHPVLGGPNEITSADSTPVLPFGHGLSYTTFERTQLTVDPEVEAGDAFTASVRIRNTGERAGTDLVQLYARDVHASVTRPVAQLLGYRRVELQPGEETVVRFSVPTTRLAFSDRALRRIVEPGAVEVWVGPSCAERETAAELTITGAVHEVTAADARLVTSTVEAATVSAVFTDAL